MAGGPSRRPVSVVVPTRDRPAELGRCLAALGAPGPGLEVIVVDDGSAAADEVARTVAAAGGRLVRTPGRGPAAARNAGARAAGGATILFVDDDCEPDPEWAERLARACPAGGAAAGLTANAEPADPYAAASQLLTSELQRASTRPDGRLGFAPSSNLAVDRELMLRLPFDEAFPAAAGEDREWCARAVAAGAAPVHEPGAVVRHRQRLEGLRGLWSQQSRYGRGAALLAARGGSLAGGGMRLRLLRAGVRAGPRAAALVAFAQLAVAWGYASERLGLARGE